MYVKTLHYDLSKGQVYKDRIQSHGPQAAGKSLLHFSCNLCIAESRLV